MSRRILSPAVRLSAVLVPSLLLVSSGALAAPSSGEVQQIKQTFSQFFNAQTPTSKRVQMLENGKQFKDTLEEQSKQPIAQSTSATASNVQVQGDRAQVSYTISVSGKPMLRNKQGTLVKQNGRWKVSKDTFCQIESLSGVPPEGCPNE